MPVALLGPYRDIFRYRSFRVFWLGFTFSVLGDAMTQVALIWMVYQSTHSARAVGLLLLASGAFAFALTHVHLGVAHDAPSTTTRAYRVGHALALLRHNPILLSTTLMFMTFNLGEGALSVWLPLFSAQVAPGGAEVYGALLGVLAVGETVGSVIAGGLVVRLSTGVLICLAQGLSGLALVPLLLGRTLLWVAVSLALLGAFSAPLTIWAQTLRMRIIPPQLRGRTFALLRTLMQGTAPLAGAAAGVLLPVVGIPAMIALSALLIGLPGPLGYQVRGLRQAGAADNRTLEPDAQDTPVGSAPAGDG